LAAGRDPPPRAGARSPDHRVRAPPRRGGTAGVTVTSQETTMFDTTRLGPVPVEAIRAFDGLTVLRRILSGELPAPPITELLPFTLIEAEAGRVVFEGRPDERLLNPMGTVHGGFAMT